jgi:hypothetical protein
MCVRYGCAVLTKSSDVCTDTRVGGNGFIRGLVLISRGALGLVAEC